MSDAKCTICGEPMPPGEEMFKIHGYSGPCPKEPMQRTATDGPQQVGWIVVMDGDPRPALYNMACTDIAHDAARRWKAGIMAVYTAIGAPRINIQA